MAYQISGEAALEKSIDFLNEIGIKTRFIEINAGDFLPGLSIENGSIMIDRNSLLYPGDILHEAGHIAVVPASERATLCTDSIATRPDMAAEEMMAILWSYAVCIHLDIDPYFVFHPDGYKGGAANFVENFKEKRYLALPMLQWIGLTADEKNAPGLNVPPYPYMIKWLRD